MIGKTNAIGDVNGYNPYAQLINYTFLYNEGDECIDITGGWYSYDIKLDGWGTGIAPTLTRGSNKMTISINTASNRVGTVATTNKIPWQQYSGVVFINGRGLSVNGSSSARVTAPLQLAPSPTGYSGDVPIFYDSTNPFNSGKNVDVLATTDAHCGITLTEAGAYSISLEVSNITLLKSDNWTTWMGKGDVSGFVSLGALLADAAAMKTLMTNQDAINFMVRQCTGNVMTGVLTTPTSKNALLTSAKALAACFGNEHWNKFLNMVI